MSSQDRRKAQTRGGETDGGEIETLEDAAKAAGRGEGGAHDSSQGTPPGGDVRTVYSNDRDPGEAEPETPPA